MEIPEIDGSLEYGVSTFLDSINHGGLSKPSDYTFMLTVNCWRVFEEIRSTPNLMNQLLFASNQRSLFVKVMERLVCKESVDELLVCDNYCLKGHNLKELLVRRFFNCVAKNLVKDITNKANKVTDNAA